MKTWISSKQFWFGFALTQTSLTSGHFKKIVSTSEELIFLQFSRTIISLGAPEREAKLSERPNWGRDMCKYEVMKSWYSESTEIEWDPLSLFKFMPKNTWNHFTTRTGIRLILPQFQYKIIYRFFLWKIYPKSVLLRFYNTRKLEFWIKFLK